MRAPRPASLPGIRDLIEALPQYTPRQLARHLAVTERTFRRWHATDSAPRAALLALYWETHHGLETTNQHAMDGWRYSRAVAQNVEREKAALLRTVAELERLLCDAEGVAPNAPFYEPARA